MHLRLDCSILFTRAESKRMVYIFDDGFFHSPHQILNLIQTVFKIILRKVKSVEDCKNESDL